MSDGIIFYQIKESLSCTYNIQHILYVGAVCNIKKLLMHRNMVEKNLLNNFIYKNENGLI